MENIAGQFPNISGFQNLYIVHQLFHPMLASSQMMFEPALCTHLYTGYVHTFIHHDPCFNLLRQLYRHGAATTDQKHEVLLRQLVVRWVNLRGAQFEFDLHNTFFQQVV